MKILICIIFSLLVASACYGAIYFVDNTTGDDFDTGLTEDLAWQNVSRVTGNHSSGDTVKFKSGEQWIGRLNCINGSALASTTYTSYGNGNRPKFLRGITVTNKEYLIFKNIEFQAYTATLNISQYPATQLINSNNILLDNCTFEGLNSNGNGRIFGQNAVHCYSNDSEYQLYNISITNSTAMNGGGAKYKFNVTGVSVIPVSPAIYTNNGVSFVVISTNLTGEAPNKAGDITLNGLSSTYPTDDGVLVKSSGDGDATIAFSDFTFAVNYGGGCMKVGGGYSYNNLVDHCTLYDSFEVNLEVGGIVALPYASYNHTIKNLNVYGAWGVRIGEGGGINLGVNTSNTIVENNYMHDCNYLFQFDAGSSNNIFKNNLLENGNSSIRVFSSTTYGNNTNNSVYHNTIATDSNGRYGVYVKDNGNDVLGLRIKNNIFRSTYRYFQPIYVYATNDMESDYNSFFIEGYDASALPFTWNDNIVTGITAWRTNSSQDTNSITTEQFIQSDLYLTSASPAINNGTDVGVTHDFRGALRDSTPDIGAYEWASVWRGTFYNATLR